MKIDEGARNQIKWEGEKSEFPDPHQGVGHAQILSAIFFNIWLDFLPEMVWSRVTTVALEPLPVFLAKSADGITLASPFLEHLQAYADRLILGTEQLVVHAEKSYGL